MADHAIKTRLGRRSSATEWGAALLVAGFVAWVLACLLNGARGEVADDAYITYGYARNLAEGFGLRFNASDPSPTWGASSWLHTLFAAAAIRAGAHPLIATRVLSLAVFLVLGAAFGWTAARVTRVPAAAGVLAGLVACGSWGQLPESSTHMASGMDALLFTLAHGLVACWATLAVARPDRACWPWGLLVLGLLMLARPEGAGLALAYSVAVALARQRGAGVVAALRGERLLLGGAALGLVALMAAQFAYFGQLHPNSYYVKVDSALFGEASAWLPGGETTLRFLIVRWAPIAVLAASLAASAGSARSALRPALLLLAPSTLVVLAYSRAIHEMAAGFRYEYPLLAPLVLALVMGACALRQRSSARFAVTLLVAGVCLPLLAGPPNPRLAVWLRHPRSLATAWLREVPVDNALARIGLDLADTGLGPRASILLSGAGQVPYFSRLRAIDWMGLNHSRFSGREPLTVEQMWREIDALAPDVCFSVLPPASPGSSSLADDANWKSQAVQELLAGRGSALFKHWSRERLSESFWREMVWIRERCDFAAAYKLGPAWGGDWWVFVYVRRDSPHRGSVLDVLGRSERVDRQADLSRVFAFDPRRLGRAD